ncbi:ABC transporter permease [Bacillus sp. B-jedd]|uniref:ABC transporter permease n=1 Tax=Bacillus sp. B-jedd TaxID=1476857 RepID=UPI0005155995|nr:ABC transporter permease [Bacillus sp. B-jedd]CEG26534.1 ABC transporter [Bacillus sp. B-jedd]
MSFLWLALKDTLLIAKDRKALLTLILMPMLLIAILGSAFGTLMGDGEVKIDKFTLGIVNKDKGELGDTIVQEVFAKGLTEMVDVKEMSEGELYKMLREQKLPVGLIIHEDFSTSVMAGSETSVKLISIPSAALQSMITENVVQQFSREAAVRMEGTKLAVAAAVANGAQIPANPGTDQVLSGDAPFELVKEKAAGKEEVTVSSFQYYAAGMGVMFLLMTVTIGVSAMIEEKEQEVFKRLLVSKLTHYEYLGGKFLGILLLSSLQMLAIIVGTRFLFSVDWGSSIPGVVVIGLSFVFSASALGVMAGAFMKTGKAFSTAGMLGTQIMAAVGGSMVPLYVFPDWVNNLVKVFPNALALQSFLELMSGGSVRDVLPGAVGLLALGAVFLAIGLSRLAVERRTMYA